MYPWNTVKEKFFLLPVKNSAKKQGKTARDPPAGRFSEPPCLGGL